MSGEDIEGNIVWAEAAANITDVFDSPLPRGGTWAVGLEGIAPFHGRVFVFAPTGEGKSWALLRAGEQTVRAGGRVLLLDYENGKVQTDIRIEALIDDVDDDVRERFQQAGPLDIGTLRQYPTAWRHWMTYLEDFDLIIIDGLPSLLGKLGVDESSPSAMARFFAEYIDPIIESDRHKAAVVIADNTGWDTRRARGARVKLDKCEVAYKVTGGASCSRDQRGTIHLRWARPPRLGEGHAHLTLDIGGGEYGDLVPVTGRAGDEEAWHDATVAILVEAEQPLSRNAIARTLRDRGVKFTREKFLAALSGWIADTNDELVATVDGPVWIAGSGS